FLTAFQALHWIANLQAGERVLIHAGGSGVGTAAIQLVRLAQAIPIATSSPQKHEFLLSLGAERCIDYRTEDFAEVVVEATAGKGVDVILDFVGAPYLEKNMKSLAPDGRVVTLAAMGGAKADDFNLVPLLMKRIQWTGTTLRARSQHYKHRLTADFREKAWPHFASGAVYPVVDSIYDWGEVEEAHRYMASNANLGKIILAVGE
ncbi:MAG: zinc-binding dehydrogenase, partial [Bacteroidota bacterium]